MIPKRSHAFLAAMVESVTCRGWVRGTDRYALAARIKRCLEEVAAEKQVNVSVKVKISPLNYHGDARLWAVHEW